MEPRAPYRNKLVDAGCIMLFVLAIWINKPSAATKPVWVADNAPNLLQARGVLYYKKLPFTGYIFAKYPNGVLANQTPYVDGRQDGLMKGWYPNKVLQEERFFEYGQKQGLHKGWWPNGKRAYEYTFKDDEYNGSVKEWAEDGKPYRAFHYKMGHEEGLQQMWWPDGTVRANYVVKDGQQYGLIGRKLCRNTIK